MSLLKYLCAISILYTSVSFVRRLIRIYREIRRRPILLFIIITFRDDDWVEEGFEAFVADLNNLERRVD